MKITASTALLNRMAQEHRRVLSDWRALILLRRATFEIESDRRRWTNLPKQPGDLSVLFHQMHERGEIVPLKDSKHLYRVSVPYADQTFGDGLDVIFEANPYATLSHYSALFYHNLTEDFPNSWYVTVPSRGSGDFLPLGTNPEDWDGVEFPPSRTPGTIDGIRVNWIRSDPRRLFGYAEYRPFGYPVRVMTPERTLLDGLQSPGLSGGTTNVLRAWAFAKDSLNLDRLFALVERFDSVLMRQRVGFILEELGYSDALLNSWSAHGHRGGSSRLFAAAPFSSEFSSRWNLSLNAPLWPLHDEAA